MAITIAELQSIFHWEFLSDTSPVTYRKHTSDALPEYLLLLANTSSTVAVGVYGDMPPYMRLTARATRTPITRTTGIVLEPESETEVLLTFDTTALDAVPSTTPNLEFILEALEFDVPTAAAPVSPMRPTVPATPSTGGPSGGGGSTGVTPTRRREDEDEDRTIPIAAQ